MIVCVLGQVGDEMRAMLRRKIRRVRYQGLAKSQVDLVELVVLLCFDLRRSRLHQHQRISHTLIVHETHLHRHRGHGGHRNEPCPW